MFVFENVVRSNNPEWAAVYTVEYLFEVKQDVSIFFSNFKIRTYDFLKYLDYYQTFRSGEHYQRRKYGI